jgi:hypothetical protein
MPTFSIKKVVIETKTTTYEAELTAESEEEAEELAEASWNNAELWGKPAAETTEKDVRLFIELDNADHLISTTEN